MPRENGATYEMLEGSETPFSITDNRHDSIADPHQSRGRRATQAFEHARHFSPRQQTWRLFRDQGTRLAITIVLVVGVIITLKAFQDAGNVSHQRRTAFNVIITVLSLALGLNFLEAFKDMAKVYRWRILASRHYTVRETDLILGGENLTKLIHLMIESWKKPLTVFVCAAWIALNLLAQGSIAMIGLTYSMDSGSDSNGTLTMPGTVTAAKLDCYYESVDSPCNQAAEVPQILAHSYGEIITGQTMCPYNDTDDILTNSNQNCYYFGRTDLLEFAFRFAEYNPNDTSKAYPFFTNRIITASAGTCLEYNVSAVQEASISGPDGILEIAVWKYFNATYNSTIDIPKPNAANDASTYIYYGEDQPQNATDIACGPRCLTIYMMRHHGTPGLGGDRPLILVQCPVTISPVSNAPLLAHEVSNDNARLAAAAIALQGRYNNAVLGSAFNHNGPTQWRQYQLYPWGSAWETNDLTAAQVGARMAQFAMGSLAAMAHLNPTGMIKGTLPVLGYHLSVDWNYVIALTACIAGVHAALVALMLWYSREIVVLDDSNLVVARLLINLVGGLGRGGNLMGAKDLASAIQGRDRGGLRFGVGVAEGGGRVLELGEGRRERRFGEGEYL